MDIDTYRVVRRQNIDGERWRENGELIPEAHTYFAIEHWTSTGEFVEAKVSERDFREAVVRYCPGLEQEILTRVGLLDGVSLSGDDRRTFRAAPMVGRFVRENMGHQASTTGTITLTAMPPPVAPSPGSEGIGAGQKEDQDMGVYDSAGDHPDPSRLNEELSGTTKEDLKEQNKMMKEGLTLGSGDGADTMAHREQTPSPKGDGTDVLGVPKTKSAEPREDGPRRVGVDPKDAPVGPAQRAENAKGVKEADKKNTPAKVAQAQKESAAVEAGRTSATPAKATPAKAAPAKSTAKGK